MDGGRCGGGGVGVWQIVGGCVEGVGMGWGGGGRCV